ncbi:hypothetical protein J0S82_011511, partial [Galemys pyrenaicus]
QVHLSKESPTPKNCIRNLILFQTLIRAFIVTDLVLFYILFKLTLVPIPIIITKLNVQMNSQLNYNFNPQTTNTILTNSNMMITDWQVSSNLPYFQQSI